MTKQNNRAKPVKPVTGSLLLKFKAVQVFAKVKYTQKKIAISNNIKTYHSYKKTQEIAVPVS